MPRLSTPLKRLISILCNFLSFKSRLTAIIVKSEYLSWYHKFILLINRVPTYTHTLSQQNTSFSALRFPTRVRQTFNQRVTLDNSSN